MEEVRRQLEKEYGVEEVHGAGLRVYTTLDLDLQIVANKAVLDGAAAYERRHKWKGHLQNVVDSAGGYGERTGIRTGRRRWCTAAMRMALVTEVATKHGDGASWVADRR